MAAAAAAAAAAAGAVAGDASKGGLIFSPMDARWCAVWWWGGGGPPASMSELSISPSPATHNAGHHSQHALHNNHCHTLTLWTRKHSDRIGWRASHPVDVNARQLARGTLHTSCRTGGQEKTDAAGRPPLPRGSRPSLSRGLRLATFRPITSRGRVCLVRTTPGALTSPTAAPSWPQWLRILRPAAGYGWLRGPLGQRVAKLLPGDSF